MRPLLIALSVISIYLLAILLFNIKNVCEKIENGNYMLAYVAGTACIVLIISAIILKFSSLKNNYKDKIEEIERSKQKIIKDKIQEIERSKLKVIKDYEEKENVLRAKYKFKEIELKNREDIIQFILSDSHPFRNVASLREDVELLLYDEKRKDLKYKSRPALRAAEEVKLLKKKTKGYIAQYKEMKYRYDYLLYVFPQLERYLEDEENLEELENFVDYTDFDNTRDKTIEYLSKDEWSRLEVDERNQLALDRYKNRDKSKWVIGIEYEMYIEYTLRMSGFRVIPFGSMNGLEDLGRDLIAFKRNMKQELVAYVIQCKNWSTLKGKEIHENVICQIYGTAIEYELEHKGKDCDKVVPVLYTTVELSSMAKRFAERLGVQIVIKEKGDFPMIKCNINNGNKIYHLPFDQQYYRTQICKEGEFYAWNVEEAVQAGFRRAFKYAGYS